ncbi:Dot/Icm T4SS effector [Legionella brunensis]|uniref:Dot/Icm T4SS effector n=2 Tax=Legionella brunensis TaxID=29422 RepID=A0A0W0SK82_9GAMM|nr:Dot/Icm T4SS effector [Legionella brunensis]
MYYAYGISLMYFLRAKNNSEITAEIFSKLKLEPQQIIELQTLLSKDPSQEFTSTEIKTIIEPILGRATRNLAADHTKVEFKTNPQSTSLFTAAKYGLEFCIKQSSKANKSILTEVVTHDFSNRDYTDAEIYRLSGIKTAMLEYANAILPEIIKKFEEQWGKKEEELKTQRKELTKSEIQLYQDIILDNLLREKTIDFFLANDEKYLNQYVNHLKKEYVWGTEETLLVLHRGIQGEQYERNKQGTIDTFYDTQIALHLHRNNVSPFYQIGNPEMIINNEGNFHWTSKIPETIFNPAPKPQVQYKEQQKCEISLSPYLGALVPNFSANPNLENYFREKGFEVLIRNEQAILHMKEQFFSEQEKGKSGSTGYDLKGFFDFVMKANKEKNSPYYFSLSDETKKELSFLVYFLPEETHLALNEAFSLDEQIHSKAEQQDSETKTKDDEPSLSESSKKKDEEQSKEKQHQQFVAVAISKIDDALQTLQGKIGKVDQHRFPDAAIEAKKLLNSLQKARDKYHEALKNSSIDSDIGKIGKQFRMECEAAIKGAKPILERDLSWGVYLQNLLKSLANAATYIISFGQANSFFTPVKSASLEALEQVEKNFVDIKAN